MRSVYLPFHLLFALGLAAYSGAALSAGQESRAVSNALDIEVTHLETLWRAGERREYYVQAGRLAQGLHAHEQAAANAAALKLLSNVVAKQRPGSTEESLDIVDVDLSAEATLARSLAGADNLSAEQQQQRIRLLAKVLGSVRAQIVPDYVPRRVSMNVSPPAETQGPTMAGMDPAAIRDPAARQKYQTAILENRTNDLMNRRQRMLREMEDEFAKPTTAAMIRVAKADRAARDVIRQSMMDARLTEAEQDEVMRALQP